MPSISRARPREKLLQDYHSLRKQFWGQHLWGRGSFAVTSGSVTDEMIAENIAHQDEDAEKRGDQFTTLAA